MPMEILPDWLANLDEEDVAFIKNFLLVSGSLKDVAAHYGVTYPTVRLRLDKLISKIRVGDAAADDPYIALIKRMALNDRIDYDTAKLLIAEYRRLHGKEK